ncbi:nuclease-related domain-containing protein [Neobacillus fumarioli]|uniref:nuclease-related domain-containing protein n=1 Tax=Neobacillus fumarioli TaxID=105229 RepID=UPI00082EB6EB|nr:nuclease-related domain-containing protein [Neobacillus fumarioli]
MLYKPLMKPAELVLLEFLNTRMNLSPADKQNYFNLKKGYEGETMFAGLTEKLQCECLILNDLLLEFNGSKFQIDSLILLQKLFYLNEVKNFEDDCYFENKRFYLSNGTERRDPLLQLERCTSLLRQLLHSLKINTPIESRVVFMNPLFTLYQAPRTEQIIFPNQVNRYLNKLNMISSKLNEGHKRLAEKLISLHINESPYSRLPSYKYENLRKWFTCALCTSFSISVQGKMCICGDCNHKETVEAAVLRSVKEYRMLFPDRKITTNGIYEWCGMVVSKKRISRILGKNFNIVGVHQWAYYE